MKVNPFALQTTNKVDGRVHSVLKGLNLVFFVVGHAGVRYITEDLVRKIAKEDSLEMITNLNMTLSKDGGKKFKV